jgi:DNA repair exonuclease SbcCD ATPase subunit
MGANADPSVYPLVAEIHRLQRELDHANESVDEKLDRLEDAGHGVIGLTKKLEDARAQLAIKEDELSRLARREQRRVKRLERARCGKCKVKMDLRYLERAADGDERLAPLVETVGRMLIINYSSLDISSTSMAMSSEPPTPPTRTSEALRTDLRSVNAEFDRMKVHWAAERRKLMDEKALLQTQAREAETLAKRAEVAQKGKSSVESVSTMTVS